MGVLDGHDVSWWAAAGAWVAAVGTLIYVGLTAVLACYALKAFRLTQQQLKEAKLSREASLRPVLVLGNDLFRGFGELTLNIKNVGPGPALNVRARVWRLEPTRDDAFETTVGFQAGVTAILDAASREPHAFEFMIGAIASRSREFRKADCESPTLGGRTPALVKVCYEDAFGKQFCDKLIGALENRA